ncbi:MAG: hypothetical protein ABEJ92_05460 [Halobacteriales archaeon]
MSLAADARAAVDERPFLREALRAGVVNYSAAARAIDIADDVSAVATALRRYADRLPDRAVQSRAATVTMHSGLAHAEGAEALLSVNGQGFAAAEGNLTGVLATGEVDAAALGHVLGRLASAGVAPTAAGVAGESLCVVVERRDGPGALQAVEAALEAVPDPTV